MSDLPEIPGYRLKKLLGQGGTATVFLAEPAAGGNRVAIKVMSAAAQTDPGWSDRFLREAKLLTGFNHPNIVRVFAAGQSRGDYYMVMEYLDHGDLSTWIRQGLQPADALRLLRALALALDHAHSKGCIHRDVKPDNVMFRADGTPVLTDFGIARERSSDNRLTQIGMAIGTPRYMSPEQHRGSDVDSRTDIYALGVIFYEMLTRQVPYDGPDTMTIGMKHIQDELPRLPNSLIRFQPLLDIMLAKDPKDRPKSAQTIVTLIDRLLAKPETSVKHTQLVAEVRQRGLLVREQEEKTGFMKKACDIDIAISADDYEALSKHWLAAIQTLSQWHAEVGSKKARHVRIQLFVHPWILGRAQGLARQLPDIDVLAFLQTLGVSVRIYDPEGLLEQEIVLEPRTGGQ